MKPSTHIAGWIVVLLLIVLVVPWLTSAKSVAARVDTELGDLQAVFGAGRVKGIVESADAAYIATFIETGLISRVDSMKSDAKIQTGIDAVDKLFRLVGERTNNYLNTIGALFYALIVRALAWLAWMVYLWLFVVACVLDGYVVRRIKQSSFGFFSPTMFGLSLHGVILAAFLPIAYMLVPLPISIWFSPVWALCMGILLRSAIPHVTRLQG